MWFDIAVASGVVVAVHHAIAQVRKELLAYLYARKACSIQIQSRCIKYTCTILYYPLLVSSSPSVQPIPEPAQLWGATSKTNQEGEEVQFASCHDPSLATAAEKVDVCWLMNDGSFMVLLLSVDFG